jgi:hypothetical protein
MLLEVLMEVVVLVMELVEMVELRRHHLGCLLLENVAVDELSQVDLHQVGEDVAPESGVNGVV